MFLREGVNTLMHTMINNLYYIHCHEKYHISCLEHLFSEHFFYFILCQRLCRLFFIRLIFKVVTDDDQLAAGERKVRRGGFQTLRNNTLRQ